MTCHFIPPYLLNRVASAHVDADVARCGHSTLAIDEGLRSRRTAAPPVVGDLLRSVALRGSGEDAWTVYTANNASALPGTPVRSAGEPESGDMAVDEAYVGVEASVALFKDAFDRDSYDGRGGPVIATVHYEKNYDNAFWDGRQLVFGDGDGRVFDRFTKPVDVLAHEFTHAVTQYTAAFSYQGQSGALNESMSDLFASCVKQHLLGQSATQADWLIGEGIFMPSVDGRALRSMSSPGTAYDDPVIGKDPQVGSMADYVETSEDNGGVHINSGIPNRAFQLAATGFGGPSWERAAQIWYAALTSPSVNASTDFAGFAQVTIAAARELYEDSDVVAGAWQEVGVSPSQAPSRSTPSAQRPAQEDLVQVRRSGGFAGQVRTGEVELGADPRTAEVQQLLTRIDFAVVGPSTPQPDRFVYAFWIKGEEVTVGEQALTPELSRLASLLLGD